MHLLVWFPGGPKGRFMQYISVVKPPVTEPFLPTGAESPRGSRRQLEPWLQGHGRTHRHADARTRGMHPARAGVHSPQVLPPALHGPELGRGMREEAGGAGALPGSPGGRSASPVRGAPGAQPCPAPAPEARATNAP